MSLVHKLKEIWNINWVSYLITRQTYDLPNTSYQNRIPKEETVMHYPKQNMTEWFPNLIPFADTLLAWLESHLPMPFNQNEKFPEIVLSAPNFNLGMPVDSNGKLKAFWKHAAFAGMLAKKIGRAQRPAPAIDSNYCYMMGWIHNIGFLLFAYLFYPEFCLLNKWMHLQPHIPVAMLEKRLLGMGKAHYIISKGHGELGAWLMDYWGLPSAFSTVAKYHHRSDYEGPDESYLAIIQLTNRLLKRVGIGEGAPLDVGTLCLKLGFEENEIESLWYSFMKTYSLEERVLHLAS